MYQPDANNPLSDIEHSDHFVQSALDALSAHIALLDEAGQIIGVNASWRRFADGNELHDPTYGIGTNYLQVCESAEGRHSKEAPLVAKAIREILGGKRDEFYIEYPCHSKEERRWFILHITRFYWNGATRLILAHQNITELKRVQIELDDSRKRIEAILDNVANGIMTISARGRIESVNPAAAEIFGYETHAMVGQSITTLFAEPHHSMAIYKLMGMLLTGSHREVIGLRADGSLFPMYFAANEIHLGNRRLFTGIVQDLTDHKRMEGETIERERLSLALEKERELRDFKTRFISMMSHEVRTPLSSILLSSDMLRLYSDKVEPSEREMYLDNIRTQVDYLTTLVREMVAVSGSDVNRLSFSPQMTDVVSLAQQIVDEYKMLYNHSHEVQFNTNAEHIEALLDLKLVRQILNNLISNAVKYTPPGAHVEVDLIRQNGSIVMKVSDSGPGIPESDVPLLFEPFHRGANAKSVPGTGLGLTVVKQSVELHSGHIEVDTAPNQGTTFTITIPFRTSSD